MAIPEYIHEADADAERIRVMINEGNNFLTQTLPLPLAEAYVINMTRADTVSRLGTSTVWLINNLALA